MSCSKVWPTVGVIAKEAGKPFHAVQYVIRARGIPHMGRAGNARVFSEAAVQRIKSELARIDEERGGTL